RLAMPAAASAATCAPAATSRRLATAPSIVSCRHRPALRRQNSLQRAVEHSARSAGSRPSPTTPATSPRASSSAASPSPASPASPAVTRPSRTPHSGYHYAPGSSSSGGGADQPFFEGWYFKVSLPNSRDSFAWMYSVENPSAPPPAAPSAASPGAPSASPAGEQAERAKGGLPCVMMQAMGPAVDRQAEWGRGDGGAQGGGDARDYVYQQTADTGRFWGVRHELALGACFQPREGHVSPLGEVPPQGIIPSLLLGYITLCHTQNSIANFLFYLPTLLPSSIVRWRYEVTPIDGWGPRGGTQLSTAGWLSALPAFEPHWQGHCMDFTDAYFCGASKADAISYSEKNWCEAITSSYPPAPLSTHHSYPCHAPPPPPVQVCMAMGRASGWVEWQGHRIEFTDAVTYSEKNWGGAFPLKWFWCNVWSHVPLGSAVALFGPLSPHIARSFPPPYTLSHQIQCNVWSHVSLGSAVALTVAGAKRQLNLPLLANSVEEVGMVGLHWQGQFIEFVPNRGAVEWKVQPWGSWHMHAQNEQYEVTVEAHTLPGDNGTPLRAPTAEGMRFFCKDSFDGRVKLELRQRYSGQVGTRGRDASVLAAGMVFPHLDHSRLLFFSLATPPLNARVFYGHGAESTAAAVEVGGGPWWEAWEQRSRMNPAQSAIISLPLNLSTLLPPSLQPPGL
ncbi:unnamed protein product, partial [Closterium sp. NIES-65]